MVSTPIWIAATAGYAGNAGEVNQFIGTHETSFLYNGSLKSSQQTGNSVYTSSQGLYTSQLFTTTSTQTSVGYVQLQLSAVGGSPTLELIGPISIGIYATFGNMPTGSALVATVLSSSYVYSSPFWVTVPLPVTGLTVNTKYAIVTGSVGNASHYYALQHSNQTSGTYTSPDGVTWTAQTYGLMYTVYDLSSTSGSGLPLIVYDDNGARFVQFVYNTNGTVSQVIEQTITQSGSFFRSSRSLSYSNGLVTGVS